MKNVGAWLVAGPSTGFPNACGPARPRGIRTLLCPDPWRVLDYSRPRIRAQTAYAHAQRVPSPDLHAIDWRKVALPGGVCGSSRPTHPHKHRWPRGVHFRQSPAPIVETRTIARIGPSPVHPPIVVFGNLRRPQLGTKTAVTIDIEDPGTNPVRYPVIFTRG